MRFCVIMTRVSKMRIKKFPSWRRLTGAFAAFFSLCIIFGAGGQTRFSGLDISNDGRVLFRADIRSGSVRQSGLFVSRLVDLSLKQFTVFPEKIDLLENGRMILVRNSFGWFRIPVAGGLPSPLSGVPSFVETAETVRGFAENAALSNDGRWLVTLESTSPAYGNLMLVNIASGAKSQIASQVEKHDRHFPVRWSPDSRMFIYERSGKLYYYPIGDSSTDERYRLIGDGGITCVVWEASGDFFYINRSDVYRVKGSEILFRSMYRDFLEIGQAVLRIPFIFDPEFDAFYAAPDTRSLLISRGDRMLFFYPLEGAPALPALQLPEFCGKPQVLWSGGNIITVFTDGAAYRLNAAGGARAAFSPITPPDGMKGAALSPDGTKALLWGEKGAALYDYAAWRQTHLISDAPSYTGLWLAPDRFIIGGAKRIERIGIESGGLEHSLICLSQADTFAFEIGTNRILAQNAGVWYATDGRLAWVMADNPQIRPASLVSGRYRVYLEDIASGFDTPLGVYENIPMIRNTASVGTAPFLRVPPHSTAGRIALCFDIYDDVTGLDRVLDALDWWGVKATFFLNGECIRQYPAAVKRIADAGHEMASLFFAPLDLTTTRYTIDSDFIARGLARNEDDFFAVTNRELALLWHPPFYKSSPTIQAAAAALGYETANRTFDAGDAPESGAPLRSASELADILAMQARNGAVIPIRIGLREEGGAYLYSRIFVILDTLARAGFTVVPVSALSR